jgi:hypothetical protein
MSCLAALTKRFGALKSAVTSTVRKGVTLILSYILFPEGKTFTIMHGIGTIIFLGGLFLESTTKLKKGPKGNANLMSEEDEEIGIITGDLNEAEPLLPLTVSAEEDFVIPGDIITPPIIGMAENAPYETPSSERGLNSGWVNVSNGSATSLTTTPGHVDGENPNSSCNSGSGSSSSSVPSSSISIKNSIYLSTNGSTSPVGNGPLSPSARRKHSVTGLANST